MKRKDYATLDGVQTRVLQDLAFSIPRGAITCLIGPSGCGKTTTLRLLLGLDPDFDGMINSSLAAGRTAMVFQDPRLLPWRTVEANIRLALPPELADANLDNVLREVELGEFHSRYPGELSLGMARRVALARAFAVEPDLLLLDEPFASLDEPTANRLREVLVRRWRAAGMTVLMVTHNIREALQLADKLIVLSSRPARVVGVERLPWPRPERHGQVLEQVLARLADRYAALVSC